jgi:hypothetical protein
MFRAIELERCNRFSAQRPVQRQRSPMSRQVNLPSGNGRPATSVHRIVIRLVPTGNGDNNMGRHLRRMHYIRIELSSMDRS